MLTEIEIWSNIHTQVSSTVYRIKDLAIMHGVGTVEGPSRPSDVQGLTLRRIKSHIRSHSWSMSRLFWSFAVYSCPCTVKYTAVSSANKWTGDCKLSGRSLMYSKNKMGPRTDPWGAPDDTGSSSELSPSRTTVWLLPTRKDSVHLSALPWTPCTCSLYRSLRGFTLSKALLKSSKIKSVCLRKSLFLQGPLARLGFTWSSLTKTKLKIK